MCYSTLIVMILTSLWIPPTFFLFFFYCQWWCFLPPLWDRVEVYEQDVKEIWTKAVQSWNSGSVKLTEPESFQVTTLFSKETKKDSMNSQYPISWSWCLQITFSLLPYYFVKLTLWSLWNVPLYCWFHCHLSILRLILI